MKIKLLFLIFLFSCKVPLFAQSPSAQDIIEIAKAGSLHYLDKIPTGQETHYGFNNRNECKIAVPGIPFHVFILSTEFFSDTGLVNNNYLVPTDEWRVTLTVNDEPRVMITVAKVNGILQVAGIGASGLASELGAFGKKNPGMIRNGIILRVLNLDCEFLVIPGKKINNGSSTYFLKSSSIVFGQPNDHQTSFSLNHVLTLIKNKTANK